MIRNWPVGLTDTFMWSSSIGMGVHTRPAMLYTGDYFAHYQKLDATPMGEALTAARVDFVSRFIDPSYGCDIGIGGGRYVQESGGSGFDVCADAITWLESQEKFQDESYSLQAATCWDSLEHMPKPETLLARVREWLFVSLPICETEQEWLASKHFKPSEHLWYWSRNGFINWVEAQGFDCVEINNEESRLGREGILSFAFKRVSD